MRAWLDVALSVLLAPECAGCRQPLDRPTGGAVCLRCWAAVVAPPFPCCDCCGDPLPRLFPRRCRRCTDFPPLVERTRSAGLHDGSLRQIVHALKYDGRRSLAAPLAALMRERDDGVLADAVAVVPVPLHWRRRLARGFNQADDLARHLRRPVVHALARRGSTRSQADLSAIERQQNVRGAFAATRHASPLSGRCVALIDDVTTTGATLNACAAVLRDAGIGRVLALTAARAAIRQP